MILSFLKKPYPFLGNFRESVTSNFFIGLFVALFLIAFEPFGTSQWETDFKMLKLAGFGLISFLVPTLVVFFLYKTSWFVSKEDTWTVGKEIFVILLILLCIALGNLLFGCLLCIASLSFSNYISALIVTFMVGIFPVTFHVTRKHNRLLRQYVDQSRELNQQVTLHHSRTEPTPAHETAVASEKKIELIAENNKDRFSLFPHQLLYIQSADNYCEIVFFENGQRKKQLLRGSLKRAEAQIDHPSIIRCHRAYLVNLTTVKKVEGNAAGYRLYFEGHTESVPVSRNFVNQVGQILKSLN